MKVDQQGAVSLTRREAINVGFGTLLGPAVAAAGTRAEDGKATAEAASVAKAMEHERKPQTAGQTPLASNSAHSALLGLSICSEGYGL